jgi:hypothetical protein
MTQDFDLSDILTRLKCYEIILSDIHPTGEWMLHAFYQRYINQPYGGLTRREMAELLIDLQSVIAALTPANYAAWVATQHQPT